MKRENSYTLVFCLVLAGLLAIYSRLDHYWFFEFFGIRPMAAPFIDLEHTVKAGRLLLEGGDPYTDSSFSGGRLTINLPYFTVLLAGYLSFIPISISWLGVLLFIPLAGLGAWQVRMARSWVELAFMMLAWFSSAMALLVERGNIDVLMLYLVWAAFYYSEKRKDILTGNVLASLASILKIYPLGFQVALAASQYKEYSPRLARIIGVAFLGGFCLYFLLTYQQIQVMTANYPKFNVTAFGLLAFNYPNLFTTQLNAAIVYLMYSIATTIVIFSVWPLWKNHQVVDIDRTQSLIGVSLFLFVVVFSINYDYRLVMLLTTIPLFLEYFRRQGTQRWVGIGFACVFLFLMNIHLIEKQLGALTHSSVTLPLMLLYAKSFTVALLFGWFGLHLVYPFVQNLFTGVENESPVVTNV